MDRFKLVFCNILILVAICLSCLRAKSQSSVVFPVITHKSDLIERVFSKEKSDVNKSIANMDAIIHFQESDSTFDIYYMERDQLYAYLWENRRSVFGILIKGRLIGVDKAAKRFVELKGDLVWTSKIVITRPNIHKDKDLIYLPTPMEYYRSSYKLYHSELKLIDRNFICDLSPER